MPCQIEVEVLQGLSSMTFTENLSYYIQRIGDGGGMTPTDLFVWSLILLASLTLSCLIVFFITLYVIRIRHARDLNPRPRKMVWGTRQFIPLFVFGHPRRWMAFRSRNLGVVRNALGLSNAEVCSWEQGLSKASESSLFITPPIRGWILVFGHYLPNPTDDIDQFYRFMRGVSNEVGEVQYFCLDSVVSEHAWVRLIDGNIIRAYVWSETTLWDEGAVSAAETSLQMKCFEYGSQLEENSSLEYLPLLQHNVDHLHALAARWSLDPLRVEPKDFTSEFGLTGEMDSLRAN